MEQDIEICYNAYGATSISAQKDNFLIGSIVSLILQCLKETLILPIFEFLISDIIQYALYCANSSTNIISVRKVLLHLINLFLFTALWYSIIYK